jgi:hypothetical protein
MRWDGFREGAWLNFFYWVLDISKYIIVVKSYINLRVKNVVFRYRF